MSELIHIDNVGGFLEKLKTLFNVTGNAPMGACRAWITFDGTTTTPTIKSSFNVTSITDNGAGDYTINFTNAMPTAEYSIIGMAKAPSTSVNAGDMGKEAQVSLYAGTDPTTTSCRFRVNCDGGSGQYGWPPLDVSRICIAVFC